MKARLMVTALALAWSSIILAGCTERPTEPLVAMKPQADIGPQAATGPIAIIEHEDVSLLYTGQVLELSGTYEDSYNRPAVSWTWAVKSPADSDYTFSDQTSQNTTFTATDPADYVLTLEVCVQGETDEVPVCSHSAIDPEFDPASLFVHAVVNQPPVASLVVVGGETTVALGEEICFNVEGSYDPEDRPLEYGWDFGSGALPYGESVCHTYDAAGDSTVTLEVRDEGGLTDRATVIITVVDEQPDPRDGIQSLISGIQSLVSSGQLSTDRGEGLLSKLSGAITSLDNGLTTDACKQLSAFAKQVTASIKAKKLNSQIGQALIASADAIRTQIGCA